MRILSLRFKNLNSLAGEWAIDLSHPAYSADGIFAITGPTGAGKSTILDALCLALYGRTPRLGKVSKSANEIMSRQSGECFAEVTFETQSGRFRCHWSQHRARKKPGGELQAPKHEIADADSGQLFETKLRGVAEQIESATGMDFDRFTRSMLLAQGGFAAFLQAAPDDRAPILEQITGTEIYSRISVRVHETRANERKTLDTLLAELAGMQLLTEEQEQQFTDALELALLQESNLNRQSRQQTQALAWLDGIESIERDLNALDALQHDLSARRQAFQPELEKLERATRALELAGEYADLNALRRQQQSDRQNHDLTRQALPAQECAAQQAQTALTQREENLTQKKAAQKQGLLLIRQVRELELMRAEKSAPLKASENSIADLEKMLNSLRTRQQQDCTTLDAGISALHALQQSIAASQTDAALVEQLAAIRSRFDAWRELDHRYHDKNRELTVTEAQQTASIRLWNEQCARLEAQQKALEIVQNALDRQQNELTQSLAGRDIADWRNTLTDGKDRKATLEKLGVSVQQMTETQRLQSELDSRQQTLDAEKAVLSQHIRQHSEKLSSLEREIHLLETQFALRKQIHDFDEARLQLEDGKPCPLCGAQEHPYARGNIPALDETRIELELVKTALKQTSAALSGFNIKQAENLKDLQQVAIRRQESAATFTDTAAHIRQGCALLSIDAATPDLATLLTRLQQQNDVTLKTAVQTLETVEAHEKQIAVLRTERDTGRESLIQAQRDTQTAAHNKDYAAQTLERISKEREQLVTQLQKAQQDALRDVAAYGVRQLNLDELDNVQLELSKRRDLWLERQQQKTELEKQIATLQLQTRNQSEQIGLYSIELQNRRDTLKLLKMELEALQQQRQTLFGDNSTDAEEARLSAVVETAERQLEAARLSLAAATQELAKLRNQLETLITAMTTRAQQLKLLETAFCERLAGQGFSDEQTYQAACLPEDARIKLMQQARQLTAEQTGLETRKRDKTALLESERQKQLTQQPRDQLGLALTELSNQLKTLQQQVGGIRQKLNDNEELRNQHRQRVHAIVAQKKECARWDALHELIGSADGKKYRNFAQGLTFEMMVGHANRQLQKMTDRYLLIRDDSQPLELNVVDNYQAGEIRSTKNLSGGESFIVSLALALGLSQMASKNVRIDSLFLDEGFGTLDEEALDTALETLAGLRQDGKLIGVISHVSSLKERIATQIQVNPLTGGRSAISGPGCNKMN